MKTEKEIREKIKELEKDYNHILIGSMATIIENAPRALIQLSVTTFLDGLYYTLEEKRPKYEFEIKKGK